MKNKTTKTRAAKLIRKIRHFMVRNCNAIFLTIFVLILLLIADIATSYVDLHMPLAESKNSIIGIVVLSLIDVLVYLRYYNWMKIF